MNLPITTIVLMLTVPLSALAQTPLLKIGLIGDVRLVYLNGFQNSVIAYAKGTKEFKENKDRLNNLEKEKVLNASDWNGGLGKKQLDWLRDQVDQANLSKQILIVFGHQPIIPGEEHSMWDSQKLIDILAGYKHQVLYLCGHKHSGGDHILRNIRVMNLKGMVEQPLSSFGILSIYRNDWEIEGFGDQSRFEGQF